MSKRKSKVQLGKIYRIEDPSGQAHFGMPYKAYKKKKKYDVYKFSRSRKKSYTLEENIDPLNHTDKSHVRKRPERVGDNYIKTEYPTFVVKNHKDKITLRRVRRNPIKIRGRNE